MTEADLEDVLLLKHGHNATPGNRRRIIGQLVATLSEITHRMDGYDDLSQISVVRLTAIIQSMADSIAVADDATFVRIVREAALLIGTLKHRRADFARLTVH